jgi:hypothetical protein
VTAFPIPEEREKYFDSDSASAIANLANLTAPEKADVRIRADRVAGTLKRDEIVRINNEDVYLRLHQFIKAEKPHFLSIIEPVDLFRPYYVHPKMSNRRILTQAGAFIIHGLTPPKSISYAHAIGETRFIIPRDQKAPLRDALALMGINESTLFPEIDRAAKRIQARYTSS